MAQFIAANHQDLVLGEAMLAFVNPSFKRGQEIRTNILLKHIGEIPLPNQWYSLQSYLDALQEISQTIGENNLFLLGVALVEKAPAPVSRTLREAFNLLNKHYKMHHQLLVLADVGDHQELDTDSEDTEMYWEMLHFDSLTRQATLVSRTPYPSKMEEGVLAGLLHKFRLSEDAKIEVKVDVTKERRSEGGNSCTYLISW